jgi:hypothetical protein
VQTQSGVRVEKYYFLILSFGYCVTAGGAQDEMMDEIMRWMFCLGCVP